MLKVWTTERVKEGQHWVIEDYNPRKREGEHEADMYVTRKIVGENGMFLYITFNDDDAPFTSILAETKDDKTIYIDTARKGGNRKDSFQKCVISAYRRYRRECEAKIDAFLRGDIELESV